MEAGLTLAARTSFHASPCAVSTRQPPAGFGDPQQRSPPALQMGADRFVHVETLAQFGATGQRVQAGLFVRGRVAS
ncbi:unannotated protein [freshwater metagenome]|uniref:Unannotated protein n=1 Tax=freshwater metagenome TaxID=449393 RepID=A0A6J7PTD8_9ZZZZ